MVYVFDEKKLSLYSFPLYIFFSILAGGIVGTLLDRLIRELQGDNTSWAACAGYLFFQLIIMSFLIYVFVFGYFGSVVSIENFTTGSFFFNLAFLTLQPSIASNLQTVLGSKV